MPMIVKEGKQAISPVARTSGFTVSQSPAAHAHVVEYPMLVAGQGIVLTEDSFGNITIETQAGSTAASLDIRIAELRVQVLESLKDMKLDIAALIERVDEMQGLS